MPVHAILASIALSAIAVPALIVTFAPPVVPHKRVVLPPKRIVPQAEVPEVEPVEYADLTADDARAFNATIPYSTDPNPAARPFSLNGTAEDKARAVDCMAAAMLYEAGDDAIGQRSVGQVVINRTRHPAFPKTICGVVFQGQERSTGCQFSFTCDGAMVRHAWSDDAWKRARQIATHTLNGEVFKPVGYSTHYHTDWVVPYWQSSLDKVTKIRTHLFFRWTGWWGTPPAFRRAVSPSEPVIPALALYSEAHRTGAALVDAAAIAAAGAEIAGMPNGTGLTDGKGAFIVTLDPKIAPESFDELAAAICETREYCKVLAWANKANTPTAFPVATPQLATLSFSYLRDRAIGFDKALWNCSEFKRSDTKQCMKALIPPATTPATGPVPEHQTETFRLTTLPGSRVAVPVAVSGAPAAQPTADGLSGIRRRLENPADAAKTSPSDTRAVTPKPATQAASDGQ